MSAEERNENAITAAVRRTMDQYFCDLEGERPASDLYDMVLQCVEKPLIEVVLQQTGGNQTLAAAMLGINRNTLRKKMQLLGIGA